LNFFTCGKKAQKILDQADKFMQKQLTVIITHEEEGYVSLCPEFDIASQGESIEDA